jgi:hypothetical protein
MVVESIYRASISHEAWIPFEVGQVVGVVGDNCKLSDVQSGIADSAQRG